MVYSEQGTGYGQVKQHLAAGICGWQPGQSHAYMMTGVASSIGLALHWRNHPGEPGAVQPLRLPTAQLAAPTIEELLTVQGFAIGQRFQHTQVLLLHHRVPFSQCEGLHLERSKPWTQIHQQAKPLAVTGGQIAADDNDINVTVLLLRITRNRTK